MSIEAMKPSASSSLKGWTVSKIRPESSVLRALGSGESAELEAGTRAATATRLVESAIASSASALVVRNRTMMEPGMVCPTWAVRGGCTTMSMAYRISSGERESRPDLELPEVRALPG